MHQWGIQFNIHVKLKTPISVPVSLGVTILTIYNFYYTTSFVVNIVISGAVIRDKKTVHGKHNIFAVS